MLSSLTAMVRDATLADIAQIMALGEVAGDLVRWNRSHYLEALNSDSAPRVLLVAEGNGEWRGLFGFIMARAVRDEWEVENVAVSSQVRRKGLGQLLLAAVVERARQRGATRVLLEVRAGNQAAIKLYKKCGFQQDGIRKDYYSAPTEDAFLFSFSLRNSS
jgi:ribosomal-protein-alanine acetyltransferase